MPKNKPKKRRFTANEFVGKAALSVALAAGLFSLIISILLILNYLQVTAANPLDDPQLLALRDQWAAAPETDAKLVAQIRALDLLARKAFFTSQYYLRLGGYLLLGGIIVLLAALRTAKKFNPRLPNPESANAREHYWVARARARELVAFAAMLWVLGALFAAFFTPLELPPAQTTADAPSGGPPGGYPDWETMRQNWPSFRGPGAYGVAVYTTAPSEWNVESGGNIRWKSEVPLPGSNSPVIWDTRLFLSGATADKREVYCFDTETGKILWTRILEKFPGASDTPPEVGEETGFAASTMIAHGNRAAALFANGDIACYDFDGNLKWGKNLGLPQNHYGHSSSLLAYQNLLFVQYDQQRDARLITLNIDDGREVWTAKRDKISWASPACVPTPFGMQLILNSEQHVDAYDPLQGALLWQLKCLDGEVAPSPAYGGGMFFVANDNATSTAIRFKPNEKTPTPEIAWQWDQSLPDVASPLATDKFFFMATSRGEIVCLNNQDGSVAWVQEYDEGFYSSPILVGDRVYAFDKEGTAHVFKAGAPYTLLAASPMGEEVFATPAFMDGRLYVRTPKNLFCIAK